jgi:hypothetical protein
MISCRASKPGARARIPKTPGMTKQAILKAFCDILIAKLKPQTPPSKSRESRIGPEGTKFRCGFLVQNS